MTNVHALYDLWQSRHLEDADLTAELAAIRGKEKEIEDRFYRHLEFGTGGIRGIIGAGINRMNLYTVRRTAQGIAGYLLRQYAAPSVVIAYDSRNKSELFAREAAKTYAANGITTYLFDSLMPTPVLSFAVRYLGCHSGAVITASHNPAAYNGYKVYGADGCQITNAAADAIFAEISALDVLDGAKTTDLDAALAAGTIRYVPQAVYEAFLAAVQAQSVHPKLGETVPMTFVYSPLNGTGNRPVRDALAQNGFTPLIVTEQALPDGNFPTCPYPNPEEKEALTLALALARQHKADFLLATDPDCDRIGAAVAAEDGEYRILSGNEVGILLLYYLLESHRDSLPDNALVVKTIVTTDMVFPIAKKYGAGVLEVLTGFKYIGEAIGILEAAGAPQRFVFGFEESCGYLAGTHARDKDGVVAALLFVELAAYYKSKGISVAALLDSLYKEFGYYAARLVSIELKGKAGARRIEAIMRALRQTPPKEIAGSAVTAFIDYKDVVALPKSANEDNGITLPKADVVSIEMENGCKIIVRPSGTEPKIKIYYSAAAPEKALGMQKIQNAADAFQRQFQDDTDL